jgi:hypothetical protein
VARTLARSGIGPVYEQIRRAIGNPIVAGRGGAFHPKWS